MTHTPDPTINCCWCGANDQVELTDLDIKVVNRQVDFAHALYHCERCDKLTVAARWGNQRYDYKAIAYQRAFRGALYVLIYDIACGWCGRSDQLEPEEINATIGNPASQRHQYDIYACFACERYTAVSYLGQIHAYPATQDDRYPSMFYLAIEPV